MAADLLVVFCSSPAEVAPSLADSIIRQQLAACVSISSPIASTYLWKGEIQHETEVMLLIKTVPELYLSLEAHIRSTHPYENPEIIALSSSHVSEDYLAWVQQVVGSSG